MLSSIQRAVLTTHPKRWTPLVTKDWDELQHDYYDLIVCVRIYTTSMYLAHTSLCNIYAIRQAMIADARSFSVLVSWCNGLVHT